MSPERLFDPPKYPSPMTSSDPSFPRAAEWLSRGADQPSAILVGIPFSGLSLSRARCDLLPSALRRAMWSFSTYSPSLEVDLADFSTRDLGDVVVTDQSESGLKEINKALRSLAEEYDQPVAIIGGDNSITAPAMQALVGNEGGLITLDAHHDVRDYQTSGLSNGSPVRVLIDQGLDAKRIWQIGIKDFANSKVYSDYADSAGINVVRLPEVRESGIEAAMEKALASLSGRPIYVDFDLDVVDRGLAPGAPAAQPGGLHPSQIAFAAFMCGKHPETRAIDVVEVDPARDVADTTVRLACLVVLSFLAGVARRNETR